MKTETFNKACELQKALYGDSQAKVILDDFQKKVYNNQYDFVRGVGNVITTAYSEASEEMQGEIIAIMKDTVKSILFRIDKREAKLQHEFDNLKD